MILMTLSKNPVPIQVQVLQINNKCNNLVNLMNINNIEKRDLEKRMKNQQSNYFL